MCVCVLYANGVYVLLEDGCYLQEKEWNYGLFLVNHLASGCAIL